MSSNDPAAKPPSTDATASPQILRFVGLAVLALCVIGLIAWWQIRSRVPAIPVIDLQSVSPAVRRVIETAQHAVAKEPRSGLAWGRLGMVLRAHEYFPEAIDCFRIAWTLDPADLRWPYLLAIGLESTDVAASIQTYRQVIARHPQVTLPQIRLAELLLQSGDLEAAENLLTPLAERESDNPRVLYRLAQLRFRRGQPDEALALVERAHVLAPRQRAIAEFTAQLRFAPRTRQRASPAQPAIDLAQATETTWPDQILGDVLQLRRDAYWRASQGASLIESGNVAAGIQELEAAVAEAPDDWTLQARLAAAYLMTNRLDDAENLVSDALQRWPDTFELQHQLGTVRLLQHEWAQAVDAFGRAIQLKPGSAESHSDLGFCLQQTGQLEAAKAEFKEALRLNPSLESAKKQLAKLLTPMDGSQ